MLTEGILANYKGVSLTSLFWIQKPTYLNILFFVLFEFWVLNLSKEKNNE